MQNIPLDKIHITPTMTWTETSDSKFDHVVISEVFVETDSPDDITTSIIENIVIMKFQKELNLKHQHDYVFQHQEQNIIKMHAMAKGNIRLCFHGSEPYTLFKLCYHD